MEKKRCSKCGQEKSVSEFYKKGNGFEGICKTCKTYQNKNRYTYIYMNLVEKNLKQEIKIKKHVVKHALQILDTLKSI